MSLLNEDFEFPFAQDGIGEIQPCEFNLSWLINLQRFQKPIVERTVVFKLDITERVRHTFYGVGLSVGEIVGWIDAPVIALTMVMGAKDPIHHGIAHIQIRA